MQGVWTALITPFTEKNELDLTAYRQIIQDQKTAGVSGVIPCGTTGETPALSVAEKKTLITTALEELRGSGVRVIAGTGTNNTPETIEFSKWASDQGVDGVLVVTPYYSKPSQAGLESHFRAVADAISCELMLYNVPGRTGVSLTPTTISALSTHPKIRSIKEATGNVSFTSDIIDLLRIDGHQIDILSGDDATTFPLLCLGATGVVSVASNLFPRAMVAILKNLEVGKIEEARKIHEKFYPLFRDLFIDSNPVPIKYAMAKAGFGHARVRKPLAALAPGLAQKLDASLAGCGIREGSRL